jgi:Raf kinase inhibitor-like YbhB/YbcL family protein
MKAFTLVALSAVLATSQAAAELTLSSTDFRAGQSLSKAQEFNGFGCNGSNASPQLSWSGVPASTRSLAVTLYDPDAPTGSGWWHWLVYNLPADLQQLPSSASGSDAMPTSAIESRTDYGSLGFGGACPPAGDKPHRYQLTLFALDVEALPLPADTPAAQVGYYLNVHAIETATLEAHYQR